VVELASGRTERAPPVSIVPLPLGVVSGDNEFGRVVAAAIDTYASSWWSSYQNAASACRHESGARGPFVPSVLRPLPFYCVASFREWETANGGEGKGSRVSQDDNTDAHVDPEPQITTASILVR
jgi:hypothetical protein